MGPTRSADAGQPCTFARRVPSLYHVTRASAVESIHQCGLLSAAALLRKAGDAEGSGRAEWTELRPPGMEPVWLRWQRLGDHVLARRLPPDISPAGWRSHIDGMVFLSPSLNRARALLAYPKDAGIAQVVLRFETQAVLHAARDVRVCRWNNGFPDRWPVRLRSYEDYTPALEWTRGKVVEVGVAGSIPPSVPFVVLP